MLVCHIELASEQDQRHTFSSNSSNFLSVSRSSSVGFGGTLEAVENCEYVWNKVSV
jgi:hypothetical protein